MLAEDLASPSVDTIASVCKAVSLSWSTSVLHIQPVDPSAVWTCWQLIQNKKSDYIIFMYRCQCKKGKYNSSVCQCYLLSMKSTDTWRYFTKQGPSIWPPAILGHFSIWKRGRKKDCVVLSRKEDIPRKTYLFGATFTLLIFWYIYIPWLSNDDGHGRATYRPSIPTLTHVNREQLFT